MKIAAGERVLMESDGKLLTLTTHRVRYHASQTGSAKIQSIALSELSACELTYMSYVILLGLAAVAGFVGLLAMTRGNNTAEGMLGLLFAAGFVVLYFLTRRHVLVLASSGGRIVVTLRGMSTESALDFIEHAEAAKLQRAETEQVARSAA